MAHSILDEIGHKSESISLLRSPDKLISDHECPLSSPERDAVKMKDFIAHLQNDDSTGSRTTSPVRSLGSDQNSNNLDFPPHLHNIRTDGSWSSFDALSQKRDSQTGINNAYKPTVQDIQMMLQELDNERTRILNGIDNEEKERQWFFDQIEKIKYQQHLLPVMDNYPIQNDLTRQKLEQEVQQLQDTMQKKLGSGSEILKRHENRIKSLQFIEREALKLRAQTDMVLEKKHLEHKKNENTPRHFLEQLSAKDANSVDILPAQSDVLDSPRNNKMITSATQTTVDLYPNECSTNNSSSMNDSVHSPVFLDSWPFDKVSLWHSGPTTFGELGTNVLGMPSANQETASVMSFTSSMNSATSRRSTHQLGAKVEMVYSLLSMLGAHNKDEMSQTLLTMSLSRESCIAMRQSGCLPLLIQFIHNDNKESSSDGTNSSRETRNRASKALHNIINAHPDDKQGKRETRVLRLLEQIRDYSDTLRDNPEMNTEETACDISNTEQHPGPSMAALMKLSFDEEHRHTMCQLGGLQAIAELIEVDYICHGNTSDQYCVTLRRYAGMALTNLTFGDGTNKALLCSLKPFMQALVAQLQSPSEDLRQVFASVLRNLSWRADSSSKEILRDVGAVVTLMKAAMEAKKESTLKSILSALWNLSAHCSMNKADICAVDGALAFLVGTLTYKSASKTHAIVENGGGILRNISSQIAVREDYRAILRQHNCLPILLNHLRSSSLTIVSNACGTLWNLSARSLSDQQLLWEMGAVSMLRNLVHSKHKMISMGSSAALKNLLAAKPRGVHMTSGSASVGLDGNKTNAPSLLVRKQRALEAEIDQTLSETCDNIDSPKSSPTHRLDSEENHGQYPFFDRLMLHGRMYRSIGDHVPGYTKHVCRNDSRESINSTHSDTSHDRIRPVGLRYHSDKYPTVIPEVGENMISKQEFENFNSADARDEVSPETFRIAQIMQEVVHRIALEDSVMNNINPAKAEFTAAQKNLTDSILVNQLSKTLDPNEIPGVAASNNSLIYDKYLNLNLDHAKCNSKYPNVDDEKLLENAYEKDFEKMTPKVNNCIHEKSLKQKSEMELFQHTSKLSSNHWDDLNCSSEFENKCYVKSCNIKEDKLNTSGTIYGTYAETDLDNLDQPTNYSLRYVEDDDSTSPATNYRGYSESEDVMIRYFTEDTPLNFSEANSMLDLRDNPEKEKLGISEDKNYGDEVNHTNCDLYQDKNELIQNNSESHEGKDANNDHLQGKGMQSDKPTTYFEEGTPVCFSRVSSLSSLHSTDVNDNLNADTGTVDTTPETKTISSMLLQEKEIPNKPQESLTLISCTKVGNHQIKGIEKTSNDRDVAGKSVSFGEENVAEETPLMFSRCSSLGSLSSFDQHSIHDDRSSVISDFSRRASGVVSPSDLPDSPSQTMPSSPKHNKTSSHFPSKVDDKPTSIFEDDVQLFATEDTPVQFSTATSLSSLNVEDDACAQDNLNSSSKHSSNIIKNILKSDTREEELCMEINEKNREMDNKSPYSQSQVKAADDRESSHLSDPEANEDEILAACISSGMPNNSKQIRRKHNNSKLQSRVNKISGIPRSRTSSIPIKTNNVRIVRSPLNAAASLTPSHQYNSCNLQMNGASIENGFNSKTNENFSENSAMNLSYRTNPQSELKQNAQRVNGIDLCSDTSSVDDDLRLLEVIQSGMPKQKLSRRKLNNEITGQKMNSCSSQRNFAHMGPAADDLCETKFHNTICEEVDVDSLPVTLMQFNNCSFNNVLMESVRSRSTPNRFDLKENELLATPDSIHRYADEGTPVTVSSQDSLSSLSCEESSSQSKLHEVSKRHLKDTLLFKIGKNSITNSITNMCHTTKPEDQEFSKNSAQLQEKDCYKDSVSCLTENNYLPSDIYCNVNYNDPHQQFHMEDTPVCFSRNSSLSSLSLDSLGLEVSPAEQALLEDCINLGMPKPKDNNYSKKWRNKNTSKSTSKNKEYESNCVKAEMYKQNVELNGVTEHFQKNTSLEMCADEDGDSISSNVDLTLSAPSSSNECTEIPTESQINHSSDLSHSNLKLEDSFLDISETYQNSSELVQNESNSKTEDEGVEQTSPIDIKNVQVEACKLAQEIDMEAANIIDSMNQSTNSICSDLENINPPSIMGDVISLTCSMVSSYGSESLSDRPAIDSERKRSSAVANQACIRTNGTIVRPVDPQKLNNVSDMVVKALSGNTDMLQSNAMIDIMDNVHSPPGVNFELIDNVKPPSILEDIDLTSSTYSVASITSEVAEGKSENVSMKESVCSDGVFDCIKPVIAMAELYVREGMMAPSLISSYTSEYIENINPPSGLQEVTELNYSTTQDVSATLGSDTDTEDELPEDATPNVMQQAESKSNAIKSEEACWGENNKYANECVDNIMNNITAAEVQTIQEDANLIALTLIALKQNLSNDSSLNEDNLLECETLSLVSDDSDTSEEISNHSNHDAADTEVPKGPRVIKPCFENIQKENNHTDAGNGPKPVRGRRRGLTKCKRQQNSVEAVAQNTNISSKVVSDVKPTRASALRASQNQKSSGPVKSFDSSTITIKKNPKSNNSRQLQRVSTCNLKRNETFKVDEKPDTIAGHQKDNAKNVKPVEDGRPKPPIKQGTFTKDKPSQNPTSKKGGIPANTGRLPASKASPAAHSKAPSSPPMKSKPLKPRMLQSRSLDERVPSNKTNSPKSRTPSVGSPAKTGSKRIQSPSPMNRKVSNSLNNLKKGSSVSSLRNSSSNQSLGRNSVLSGQRTPNSGCNSRSGSDSLSSNKRSSSNISLCSNNSSNTTPSNKKPSPLNFAKKEVASKIATIWKKNDSDKTSKGKNDSRNVAMSAKKSGLPRSSTYETIPTINFTPNENGKQVGIKLEDKNQVNNKTFTKSPSVDTRLDDLISERQLNNSTHQQASKGLLNSDKADIERERTCLASKENVTRPQLLYSGKPSEKMTVNQHSSRVSTVPSSMMPMNANLNSSKTNSQPGKSLIPTPTRSLPPSGKRQDCFNSNLEQPQTPDEPKRNTCMITAV